MEDRSARGLIWLGMHLVFFPLLVASLHGWHAIHVRLVSAGLEPPAWLRNAVTFLIFAVVYMGLAYAAAALANRLYPRTTIESAAWEDSPGFGRKGRRG
ncbi:MAG: hypothetical protein NZ740_02865 [Kiritimatiellae bacterium]|nr:hypothetical protein [Kiritimatiellia bacterium]MDW8458034.1 hypothetical protein [Verrucomicrobiota bacterium]